MMEAFAKGFRGALKYGYLAPLTTTWLAVKRPGGYFWHLRALYRLAWWHGKRYP